METSLVQSIKMVVVHGTGLSKDALHIYVGLAVFFLTSMICRKSLHSIVPLLVVVALAVLGEIIDRRDDIASFGYWRYGASVHDVINTAFWPAAILALFRWTPLFQRPREP